MILLWKTMVLDVGVQGLQAHPQKFWFVENLAKSPENPGENGAQLCLTTKNGTQGLHKNPWRPFFGGYTKKRPSRPLWEKSCRQKLLRKLFGQVWGNSGKIFRTPKIFLLLHLWWKGTSAPFFLFWKGRGGNALAMPPFSGVLVHIILHALSLLVVVGYNVSR